MDYTALRTEPSPRRVAAWRESVRRRDEHAGRHGPASDRPEVGAPAWVGIATVIAISLLAICLITGLVMLFAEGDPFGLFLTSGLLAVVVAALLAVYQRQIRLLADGWSGPYQLMQFAHDNNLEARPVAEPGELPGRIFGRGLVGNRVRHDLVAWVQDGRPVEVATESWHSGKPPAGGPPEDSGSCRYLAVELGGDVPHLVLDGWEDAFSERRGAPHYRLQVPQGAEREATAIFNDEVLRLLTAPEQRREAEVIDGWFLAYDLEPSDPLDASTWERNVALVTALPFLPLVPPTSPI